MILVAYVIDAKKDSGIKLLCFADRCVEAIPLTHPSCCKIASASDTKDTTTIAEQEVQVQNQDALEDYLEPIHPNRFTYRTLTDAGPRSRLRSCLTQCSMLHRQEAIVVRFTRHCFALDPIQAMGEPEVDL